MTAGLVIRPFEQRDAPRVRDLFITVNRMLAPPDMREVFEDYIARALTDEMDRVADYYAEHGGSFWVASRDETIVGTFGLEASGAESFELRRMYVSRSARRLGIASALLRFAENECRRAGARRLELSTSALQPAAIALYRGTGYRLVRQGVAEEASNKTVGGGIMRYYFDKRL